VKNLSFHKPLDYHRLLAPGYTTTNDTQMTTLYTTVVICSRRAGALIGL
jgi:hypothetical protein